MYVTRMDARHAGLFGDEQRGGLWTEDERRGVHSRKINYSRRREQQACRDYWSSVYRYVLTGGWYSGTWGTFTSVKMSLTSVQLWQSQSDGSVALSQTTLVVYAR